jgi:hypothetical protein
MVNFRAWGFVQRPIFERSNAVNIDNIFIRRNFSFHQASRNCFAAFSLVEVPLVDVGGCRSPPRAKGV